MEDIKLIDINGLEVVYEDILTTLNDNYVKNSDIQDSKTVTPTTSQQIVEPDTGKRLLKQVVVDAIPDEYQDTTGTDAVSANVLSGKKFVNTSGLQTGSMPYVSVTDPDPHLSLSDLDTSARLLEITPNSSNTARIKALTPGYLDKGPFAADDYKNYIVVLPMDNGEVKSGTVTPEFTNPTYNAVTSEFDINVSGTIAIPWVSKPGYIAPNYPGLKTNELSGSTSLNKIALGADKASGDLTKKPTISKGAKATGDTWTDASSGGATTTKPTTTDPYVKVSSGIATNTLTITPKVTTAGYGTTTSGQSSATPWTGTVGAAASDAYYVPITKGAVGSPTATKGTPSNNSITITPSVTPTTGWISGGSKITGTAVSVKAEDLVSGNKSLTPSDSAQSNINVTNYKTASVSAITYNDAPSIELGFNTLKVSTKKGRYNEGTNNATIIVGTGDNKLTAKASHILKGYKAIGVDSAGTSVASVTGTMPDAKYASTATEPDSTNYPDVISDGIEPSTSARYVKIEAGYSPNKRIKINKIPDQQDTINETLTVGTTEIDIPAGYYSSEGTVKVTVAEDPTIETLDEDGKGSKTATATTGFYKKVNVNVGGQTYTLGGNSFTGSSISPSTSDRNLVLSKGYLSSAKTIKISKASAMYQSVSIAKDNWNTSTKKCTKTVTGMTSDCSVMMRCTTDSGGLAGSGQVLCTAQATNSLTFTYSSSSKPSGTITFDVVWYGFE